MSVFYKDNELIVFYAIYTMIGFFAVFVVAPLMVIIAGIFTEIAQYFSWSVFVLIAFLMYRFHNRRYSDIRTIVRLGEIEKSKKKLPIMPVPSIRSC